MRCIAPYGVCDAAYLSDLLQATVNSKQPINSKVASPVCLSDNYISLGSGWNTPIWSIYRRGTRVKFLHLLYAIVSYCLVIQILIQDEQYITAFSLAFTAKCCCLRHRFGLSINRRCYPTSHRLYFCLGVNYHHYYCLTYLPPLYCLLILRLYYLNRVLSSNFRLGIYSVFQLSRRSFTLANTSKN